jgi:hypothetical protein
MYSGERLLTFRKNVLVPSGCMCIPNLWNLKLLGLLFWLQMLAHTQRVLWIYWILGYNRTVSVLPALKLSRCLYFSVSPYGCVSTCATTQLEACQYARRRSNDQTQTCPAAGKRQIHARISRSESGRHALPCVYPLRTHFAHDSSLAYCCPYACNQRMCHIACVVAQVETQPMSSPVCKTISHCMQFLELIHRLSTSWLTCLDAKHQSEQWRSLQTTFPILCLKPHIFQPLSNFPYRKI